MGRRTSSACCSRWASACLSRWRWRKRWRSEGRAMVDWEIWAVIAVLILATAAARSAFWLIGHRVAIPKRVQEILRYAPACALAAIIGPDLLVAPGGQLQLSLA